MYTNDDHDIDDLVSNALRKGDTVFDIDLREQSMCQIRLSKILKPFQGVALPKKMRMKMSFSRSLMEDDIGNCLAEKLASINWPDDADIDITLRDNRLTDVSAINLIDYCVRLDRLRRSNITIDLDNNTGLTSDIIEYAIEKIPNSKIDGGAITNRYRTVTIEFSESLIEEYLSTADSDNESV